jgi:hypothetical protein
LCLPATLVGCVVCFRPRSVAVLSVLAFVQWRCCLFRPSFSGSVVCAGLVQWRCCLFRSLSLAVLSISASFSGSVVCSYLRSVAVLSLRSYSGSVVHFGLFQWRYCLFVPSFSGGVVPTFLQWQCCLFRPRSVAVLSVLASFSGGIVCSGLRSVVVVFQLSFSGSVAYFGLVQWRCCLSRPRSVAVLSVPASFSGGIICSCLRSVAVLSLSTSFALTVTVTFQLVVHRHLVYLGVKPLENHKQTVPWSFTNAPRPCEAYLSHM